MKQFFKALLATFIGALAAFCIGIMVVISVISSMLTFPGGTVASVPKSAILKIDLAQPVTDTKTYDPYAMITSGSSARTLSTLEMIRAIEAAAVDPAIKFIYVNADNCLLMPAQTEEIREALTRFRQSGKAVVSYATTYTQNAYYLAAISDKIILNPYGDVQLLGMSSNVLFFKDLLDKLGIEVQLIRHGRFKAAAEQFLYNGLSDENREQITAYMNSIWEKRLGSIASDREIDIEVLSGKIDNLELSSAEKAVESGLADELMYKDELEEYLKNLSGTAAGNNLPLITVDTYIKNRITENFKAGDRIAVVYAGGNILSGYSDTDITSDKYIEILSGIRKDPSVKAVVLRVDSPGGSAVAAEEIAREIRLLKKEKPVIASFGNYAASGGYWISAETDHIFTDYSTLTGSIGVFSMIPNFKKGMNGILKINSDVIKTNEHADMFSLTRALDGQETAYLQKTVETIYDRFLEIVSEGRDMPEDKVDEIAQGRVWSGADALNIGLADKRGGLFDAINYAAAVSGISEYRISEYPEVKAPFEQIMEMLGSAGASVKTFAEPAKIYRSMVENIRTESGSVMARVPYDLHIAQ